jgi:hypothetical protein
MAPAAAAATVTDRPESEGLVTVVSIAMVVTGHWLVPDDGDRAISVYCHCH